MKMKTLRKRIISLFIAIAVIITAIPVTGAISVNAADGDFVNEVLCLVNEERAAVGLAPLKSFMLLNNAAEIRAEECIKSFSHTRPNGTSCFTALDESNISYSYAGENIAAGQTTPKSVVKSWMNSEGHRANILSKNFTHLGVGMVYKKDSQYGYYWAQLFVGSKGTYAGEYMPERFKRGRVIGKTDTVEIADAVQILMYLANNPQSVVNSDTTGRARLAADINCDNKITVVDAVQVLMFLANNPSSLVPKS